MVTSNNRSRSGCMRAVRVVALIGGGSLFLVVLLFAKGPTLTPTRSPSAVLLGLVLMMWWVAPLVVLLTEARTALIVVVGSLGYLAAETAFLRSMYDSDSSTV